MINSMQLKRIALVTVLHDGVKMTFREKTSKDSLFCIYVGEEFVGVVILEIDEENHYLYIQYIEIFPQFRKKGYAIQVFQYIGEQYPQCHITLDCINVVSLSAAITAYRHREYVSICCDTITYYYWKSRHQYLKKEFHEIDNLVKCYREEDYI
jgi:hypothetical protein